MHTLRTRVGRRGRLALAACSVLAVTAAAPAASSASTLTAPNGVNPTSVPFTLHYEVPPGTDHVKVIVWGETEQYLSPYNEEQNFSFAPTGAFPTGPFPASDFGFAVPDAPDASGEGDITVTYPVNGDWDFAVAPVSSSNVVGPWSDPLRIYLRQPRNPVATVDTPTSTVGLANDEGVTFHGIPGRRAMVLGEAQTPGDQQNWFIGGGGNRLDFDENGEAFVDASEFQWFRDGDVKLTFWQGTDDPGVQNGGITDEITVTVAN